MTCDSSGLVLITNDGKLANRLAHPSFELGKTYRVLLRGQLSEKDIAELRSGVWLAEGKTSPAHVKVVSSTKDSTIAHITIHEGINRQVRRMFAKVGSKVIELERISIGPVKIEQMQPGECRPLTEEELSALREATLRKKKRKKPPHSRGRSGGGQRRAGRKDSDRGTRRGKKR
ncbi:MAG: pseudouridine synthase [Planctomycetota bacterium]|nr:pseudouridine synthase [Planctomycetota bacterium]